MEKGQSVGFVGQFDKGSIVGATCFTVGYLLLQIFVTGYRPDHLYFLLFCLAAYFAHPISRRFLLGFSIFLIYGIIFDSMKGYPNYLFSDVRIEEPYLLEKAWFGIQTATGLVTPNEYFLVHNNTFWDVVTGFFYLSWMPVPLMFGLYLWFKDKWMFIQFSAGFFTVNVVGWIIYYVYPAAPPWYVQLYGFEEHFNIPGNVAGLIKFDQFFGITLFQDMYAKGSNVFAAMPSLHSAYPVVVFFYGLKKRVHVLLSTLFGIFVIGIWFSAVYSSHHYILDVIMGALCAIAGIAIFEKLLLKGRVGKLLSVLSGKV